MLHEPELERAAIAELLKNILLALYTPRYDFKLFLTGKKPKRCLGYYLIDKKEMYIHDGEGNFNMWLETAIHEYAHHIHHTECRKEKQHDKAAHGRSFNLLNKFLLNIAKNKGFFRRSGIFTHPDNTDNAI